MENNWKEEYLLRMRATPPIIKWDSSVFEANMRRDRLIRDISTSLIIAGVVTFLIMAFRIGAGL